MPVSAVSSPKKTPVLWGRLSRWLVFGGLQRQLIVPYVLLTLVLAGGGVYIVTRLVAASVRERFANRMLDASQVAADNVVRLEQFHLTQTRLLANTGNVWLELRSRNVDALKLSVFPLALNANLDLITTVDIDGYEIVSWARDPVSSAYIENSGRSFEGFVSLEDALAGKLDAGGDKFVGLVATTFGPALVTVAGVKAPDGGIVGAVMVGTLVENFLNDTQRQAFSYLALLTTEPQLIYTTLPDPTAAAETLEGTALLADPADARTFDIDLYGAPYQVLYAPWIMRKETLGWIGVIMESNYIVASESQNRNALSLIFAVSTLGVIIIGYLVARYISEPILRLRTMSQAVASGNLNQTIQLDRTDEIGELANAFDTMTDHLRERTAEAERLYQESIQRNKELAEINARLQATQLQLVQSEKLAAIGQLTAGIVHDVKNPLAVVKGLAEIMQDEPTIPEEFRKELRVMRESAEKGNRIVSDLLKFARQSAPEMKAQDMRETVEAAIRLTTYLIREARVQLVKEIPEKPIFAKYDAQQIEQVLINMIHNAIHAMPNRGTLRIGLVGDDDAVRISLADTGTGIAPEHLKRIFDPFFTTKPEGKGTGLGLSVSYGIIANHRGRIEVQSELGKGTTFTIILPIEQVAVK